VKRGENFIGGRSVRDKSREAEVRRGGKGGDGEGGREEERLR
jgi:hypothetical protein